MALQPGTFELGPQDGKLLVRTGKEGAASKAGHNLLIEVLRWTATVQLADNLHESLLELSVDSSSLRVLEGTGGMTSLDSDDMEAIARTINEEVLKETVITFKSTSVRSDGDDCLHVTGDLVLLSGSNPIAFKLTATDDGRLRGTATVKQTEWGMKPYSALFGTLKVTDEVAVEIDARLRPVS